MYVFSGLMKPENITKERLLSLPKDIWTQKKQKASKLFQTTQEHIFQDKGTLHMADGKYW